MNQYLVDRTRDHLIDAAEYAATRESGDLVIQILARPQNVMIRACAGGIRKAWLSEVCGWDDIATAFENPLPRLIDGIVFRLERMAPPSPEPAEAMMNRGSGG